MKEGTMVIWCTDCKKWFTTSPEKYKGECPACHNPVKRMKCTRCGHEWVLRGVNPPKGCPNPKCKSPYWCYTRVRVDNKKVKE